MHAGSQQKKQREWEERKKKPFKTTRLHQDTDTIIDGDMYNLKHRKCRHHYLYAYAVAFTKDQSVQQQEGKQQRVQRCTCHTTMHKPAILILQLSLKDTLYQWFQHEAPKKKNDPGDRPLVQGFEDWSSGLHCAVDFLCDLDQVT